MQKLIGASFILICGIYYSISEYIRISRQEKLMSQFIKDLDKIISLIKIKKLGVSEIFSSLSDRENGLSAVYKKCIRWDFQEVFKNEIMNIIENRGFCEKAGHLAEILGRTTANEQVRLFENLREELTLEYQIQRDILKKTQKLRISLGIVFTLIVITILI